MATHVTTNTERCDVSAHAPPAQPLAPRPERSDRPAHRSHRRLVGIASGLCSGVCDQGTARDDARPRLPRAAVSAAAASRSAQRPTKTIVTTKVVAGASASGHRQRRGPSGRRVLDEHPRQHQARGDWLSVVVPRRVFMTTAGCRARPRMPEPRRRRHDGGGLWHLRPSADGWGERPTRPRSSGPRSPSRSTGPAAGSGRTATHARERPAW